MATTALTMRRKIRRRLALLGTVSFVASGVMAGAGVLTATLTPSIALA